MDQVMNKVGSYWLGQQANKEFNTVGNEINALSNNLEDGAKWLVNKIKGKVQKPLTELLKENDLPIGLFPRDATNYEFNEETKKIVVHMTRVCDVGYKDQSAVRFNTTVTAVLEQGKLSNIDGMKTKMIMFWVKVSCITCQDSNKLHFAAASIGSSTRNRDAYEVTRDGVIADTF
ncbi:UNVERIFIED_CONTAM: hypothetical protein Sradi_4274000 [Sesamum radiatum]|uniref:Uncharacterized protein n=1 Tax=Sesamum radiatum TaxID=300843 RepID=A0AAW2NN33_SESRA